MKRTLLVGALLLLLGAVLMPGHARAQQVYTARSLAPLLLTPDEVAAVVSATGIAPSFIRSADTPTTDDPITVGRVFLAGDGSLLSMTLGSLVDGSAPTGDDRRTLLNGQFARIVVDNIFSSISGYSVGPSIIGDGQDVTVQFTGIREGASYQVVADTFIHGNVFGIIIYASAGDADLLTVAAMLGGQLAKLP